MHHVGEVVEEQAEEVGDLSEDFVGIVGAVVGAEEEEDAAVMIVVDAAVMMVVVDADAAVMMVVDADAVAPIAGEDMVVVVGEEAVIKTLTQYSASKFLFWFIISLPWVKPSDVRNLLGAQLLSTQKSLLPKMGSLRK